MLTVVDEPEVVKQVLKAGATDFLTKPVDIEVLEGHVRRLADNGA
jgi:DNA-binding response OmpR family regulator